MPPILSRHGFRLSISHEGSEPPHIHVEHGDKVAKYWLNPVDLAMSEGFRSHELKRVRAMVIEHRILFLEKWNEHFGGWDPHAVDIDRRGRTAFRTCRRPKFPRR
jgi:hypothetical protein